MNPAKNTDYINLTKIINLNSTPKSHKNTNKINQIRLNFSTFCKAIELVGMRVLKTKNTNMTYDHGLEVKIRSSKQLYARFVDYVINQERLG